MSRVRDGLKAEQAVAEHYQAHGFPVKGGGRWDTYDDYDLEILDIPVEVKTADRTNENLSIAQGRDLVYDQIPDLIIVGWSPTWPTPRHATWAEISPRLATKSWLPPSTRTGYGGRPYKVIPKRWLKPCIQCATAGEV